MDIQQLKLLAGRIRGLLEHANIAVTHSQALDLSGALVGLRNWPEVQAFPARVVAVDLDLGATGRLANRLQRKHALDLSARELLDALQPPGVKTPEDLPHIWPAGPRPGVYVTTEHEHINALLAVYDEATDGALMYAERAGNHWKTSIDLGEHGLWSSGLDSVPSGTLLVLGPLDVTQQSWSDTSSRLESACLKAQAHGHRVAVLLQTETPHTLSHDVDLMVRLKEPDGDDAHEALLGVVAADGALVERKPFVEAPPPPVSRATVASLDPLPPQAVPFLRKAFEQRPTGILLLGSSEIGEHWAAELVNAVLPLTDFAGPAARIRSRSRSTPAKDWNVPQAMKQLPFLPSIESAYSLGYRRMVINPSYTDEELIDTYADDVLFIAGGYGGSVENVFLSGVRYSGFDNADKALDQHIAILALTHLKTSKVDARFADMYVPDGRHPTGEDKFDEMVAMIQEHR
ncbi:MAG: hypothetical protein Q7V53_02570, partial [Caldisericota bacterium]|nr:hypothetical protein [Caldisericota bacterium]